MKKLVLLFTALCCMGMLFSLTIQTTTWSTNQTITEDTYLQAGHVLTIDSGVVVTFTNNSSLIIYGELEVDGNSSSLVTFTSATSWGGLILDSAGASNIIYAEFENVEGSGAIQVFDTSDVLIDNCEIMDSDGCHGTTVVSGGILISGSDDITISNCYIHDNEINDTSRAWICGTAITIYESEDISIVDCVIENNVDVYDTNTYLNHMGAVLVKHSDTGTFTSADAISITGCEITGNESYYGGGIGIHNYNTTLEIEVDSCKLIMNQAELAGGGMYCHGYNMTISNNIISSNDVIDTNSVGGYGGGLYIESDTDYDNVIFKNLFYCNYARVSGGGAYVLYAPGGIRHNVFAYNEIDTPTGNNGSNLTYHLEEYQRTVDEITNNIFYLTDSSQLRNVRIHVESTSSLDMLNNCYYPNNLYFHDEIPDNIDDSVITDPLFVDPGNRITYPESYGFELTEFSPCVNAGYTTSTDYDTHDNSPKDIGIWANVDNTEQRLIYQTINWISFPRLATDGYDNALWASGNSVTTYQENEPQIDDIANDEMDLDALNAPTYDNFDGLDWLYGYKEIFSVRGYKLTLEQLETYDITGPRLPDDTNVSIPFTGPDPEYFWLGFWKEGTTYNFHDFVGEIEDDCIAVQHQKWYIYRTGTVGEYVWKGDKDAQIDYGQMVAIKVTDGFTFTGWYDVTAKSKVEEVSYESEYFTYEEQLDYLPIAFEVPDTLDVAEVGIYINGVCKGYGKVDDENMAYIRAYVFEEPNPENVNLQFVYYSGSKSTLMLVEDYNVMDPKTGVALSTKIDLINPDTYYIITADGKVTSFEDTLPVNKIRLNIYPNPMTSENVNIAYEAKKDANLSVSIFNIKGQKVANVFNGISNTKKGELVWNGKDSHGKSVANGVYFMRVDSDGVSVAEKFMIMK